VTDLDAFLAECDDVIADWEGSDDSASWAADGSHEHDTGGHYYGSDRFGPTDWLGELWREIERQAIAATHRELDGRLLRGIDNAVFDEPSFARVWLGEWDAETRHPSAADLADVRMRRARDVRVRLTGGRRAGRSERLRAIFDEIVPFDAAAAYAERHGVTDETRALLTRRHDPAESARLYRPTGEHP
jgi:hypothetical protein